MYSVDGVMNATWRQSEEKGKCRYDESGIVSGANRICHGIILRTFYALHSDVNLLKLWTESSQN